MKLLAQDELEQFFKLHRALLFFVNQRLHVVPDKTLTREEFSALPPEVRILVRDAMNDNLDLIESFIAEKPAHLTEDEFDIVRSWRHRVTGQFYIFRELKNHTVFLSTTSPSLLDDNPMVWMLQINGFMMDVRHAPIELQEMAFNKGLIPYIPADRRL